MTMPLTRMPDSITTPDETTLVIRRSFRAPVERVFRALTDGEALKQWFAPGQITCLDAKTDLRVGGAWSIDARMPDGEAHCVSGEYLEIDPPRRVVFTWAWRSTPERVSRVTYALSEAGDGTTVLTLTHERFFDAGARDRHAQGWGACLDKLVDWLAENEARAAG